MRKPSPLTYGKLDRFLKKLGFERLTGDRCVFYRHANGAGTLLPDAAADEPVLRRYALEVRHMLEWNGFEQMTHEVPL